MTCNEAVSAITTRISAVSLASSGEEQGMSSASSMLLLRAELWHYSFIKVANTLPSHPHTPPTPPLQLHNIGVLCGLMPSSNALNIDKELIHQITRGITPVTPHGEPGHMTIT